MKHVRQAVVTPDMKPENLPQYVKVKEAASYLRKSEWSIREGVKQGKIPNEGPRFGRRGILIPREFFEAVTP
jgi:hypothetical protein